MSTIQRTRIFLVDDHQLVLESYRQLLEPRFEIAGESSNTIHLKDHIRGVSPDIVLLDISMPAQSGYDLAKELIRSFPKIKIIFVSMHLEPTFIMEAFRSGGKGYVPKQTAGNELVEAIEHVMGNRIYMSPLIPEDVRNTVNLQMTGIQTSELSGKLTPRQQEILRLVAQGLSAKDIAEILNITQSTVAFHKAQIIQTLGLKSKAELTKYAVLNGISPLKETQG
ncbi:MAG: response regulator [Nitrospirales bacterium]|nr:response regulator transcription factor [Nitrospirales bacterium]